MKYSSATKHTSQDLSTYNSVGLDKKFVGNRKIDSTSTFFKDKSSSGTKDDKLTFPGAIESQG